MKYAIAILSGFAVNMVFTHYLIPFMRKIKFGQSIRKDGPQSHLVKEGTPTMGGVGFVVSTMIVSLFVCPSIYTHLETVIVVLAFIGYGLIGFLDDFIIVVKKDNEGLKPKQKLALQSILAIVFFLLYHQIAPSTILIPFVNWTVDFGWFYAIIVFVMFTGETNAVNFADGLDGLCVGLNILALIPFMIFAYKEGQMDIVIFLMILWGALWAYFYYNHHPAKIFMGDMGSLALGGILAACAMVLKQEVALIIVGGVFLMEMISVVMQVSYFKLTHGKRIFKMAPIHHHFELSGWSETKVVRVFWAIGAVLSAIGILMGVMM